MFPFSTLHALPSKKVMLSPYNYKMTHVKRFQSGAAKDFEIVEKVRNVIVLEDNGLDYQWEDDEWEQIYDKRDAEEQLSYSSVLRGNET
jgi:hypothetical protein